jgi:hypothetical protein
MFDLIASKLGHPWYTLFLILLLWNKIIFCNKNIIAVFKLWILHNSQCICEDFATSPTTHFVDHISMGWNEIRDQTVSGSMCDSYLLLSVASFSKLARQCSNASWAIGRSEINAFRDSNVMSLFTAKCRSSWTWLASPIDRSNNLINEWYTSQKPVPESEWSACAHGSSTLVGL